MKVCCINSTLIPSSLFFGLLFWTTTCCYLDIPVVQAITTITTNQSSITTTKNIRRKLQTNNGAISMNNNNNLLPIIFDDLPPPPPILMTTCTVDKPSIMSEWHITDYNNTAAFIQYNELSDFLEGPGLTLYKNGDFKKLRFAVCEFRELKFYNHYPHAMQQLLRCFSWFMANPKLPRRILWPKGFFDHYATDTLMHFLHKFMNINLVHDYKDYYTSIMVNVKPTNLIVDDIELTDFAMLNSQHVKTFQDIFIQHINDGLPVTKTLGCTSEKRMPRISIVNRSPTSKRNFMNDIELKDAIQQAFPKYDVNLTYFEKMPFEEQIQFMMTSDIVISPHGAQLQHIMFMPSYQCSAVMEFFPAQYFNPDFYGSLSKTFGLKHSFYYMDTDLKNMMAADETLTNTPYHKIASYEWKNYPICLNIPEILKSVSTLVNEWNQCCERGEMGL